MIVAVLVGVKVYARRNMMSEWISLRLPDNTVSYLIFSVVFAAILALLTIKGEKNKKEASRKEQR